MRKKTKKKPVKEENCDYKRALDFQEKINRMDIKHAVINKKHLKNILLRCK